MKRILALLIYLASGSVLWSDEPESLKHAYVAPGGMVRGGQFIDRFLPVELNGALRSDVWGGSNVLPRDVANGMEDQAHSYWGGNIVKGDDGKYHMFPCRWREDNTIGTRSGHMTWGSSQVVHAVADKPTGPYAVVDVIGGGHNPEVYSARDGGYILGTLGYKAYKSQSLDGPWTKIETTFQWKKRPNNTSNRTYVRRDDGTAIVMTQNGFLYLSEQDEDFIELFDESCYKKMPGGHAEDPVFWKDDVQYHCVYNDPIARIAYYMRSADGIHWKWMEGLAYDRRVVKHVGGTSEGWYKMERPKVLRDEYGRATHMNFAVMDAPKWEDLASDKHSSKNLVMPLRVPRRMEILNTERLTQQTPEIRIKILAEKGFDPVSAVDVASLKFGAPEVVNFGGGATASSSTKDGSDLVVVFNGEGNGFEDHNFAGKLIGTDKSGDLVFGFAKMKPSATSLQDEIRWHTALDEIPHSGKTRFAVSYRTKKTRLLKANLIDMTTGETVKGVGQKQVTGQSTSVIHYASDDTLDLEHQYRFEIYLNDVDDETASVCEKAQKDVVVLAADAGQDKLAWIRRPPAIPDKGPMILSFDYETKTKRDIQIDFLRANPRGRLRSIVGQTVEGKGTAHVDFSLIPSDKLRLDHECVFLVYLTKVGGGDKERVSDMIRARAAVMDGNEFRSTHPKSTPSR